MIGEEKRPAVNGRNDSASPVGLWPFCVALLAFCVLLPFYALATVVLANNPIFEGLAGIAFVTTGISLIACVATYLPDNSEQQRHYHEALQSCRNCDRKMLPYNASLIFTWKCTHCGEDRRRILVKTKIAAKHSGKNKQQPFPFLDPDF